MKARRPLLFTVLVLALLGLVGCGDSSPEMSEIVTTVATTQPTMPVGVLHYIEPQPGETQLDNEHIAGLSYIERVGGTPGSDYRSIYVAYVEIPTGEEAKAAAIEAFSH